MLTYDLIRGNKSPLYEQLYAAVKNDILNAAIKPGTRLPSKRSLSEHLGISKVTVETAYSMLADEGFISSVEKKGYYAREVLLTGTREKKGKIEPEPNEHSPMPGAEKFPFSVWSRLMRESTLNHAGDFLSPVPYNGVAKLREAISVYLSENRGMRVSPSSVIIGAGTEYLYGLIIQLLGSDKRYAIEEPYYGKIPQVYAAHGINCGYISMDSEGISIESLQTSGADVIHISPAHHFPTGTVTSGKRRQDILKWAAGSESRYIIEDEYDSEFRFTGKPIPPMQSWDSDGKVIYINTFSKTISPSVRISYMILPEKLEKEFRNKLGFYSCTVAALEQYTLADFIGRGHFERHISRMKRFYRLLRDELIAIIGASPMAEKCSILEPDSGLHFVLRLNTSLSDTRISEYCTGRGIRISFLSEYYHNKADAPGHMMLVNYSVTDAAAFAEAINCINEVISSESADNIEIL